MSLTEIKKEIKRLVDEKQAIEKKIDEVEELKTKLTKLKEEQEKEPNFERSKEIKELTEYIPNAESHFNTEWRELDRKHLSEFSNVNEMIQSYTEQELNKDKKLKEQKEQAQEQLNKALQAVTDYEQAYLDKKKDITEKIEKAGYKQAKPDRNTAIYDGIDKLTHYLFYRNPLDLSNDTREELEELTQK